MLDFIQLFLSNILFFLRAYYVSEVDYAPIVR